MTRIPTRNYVNHYDPTKSHHRAWLQAVLDKLEAVDPTALQAGSELNDLWRAAVETKPAASTYENSWSGVTAAARVAGAKYPELVAAQWALESGFGKRTTGAHNYFGLKGPGARVPTQEVVNGKAETVQAEFLNFKDLGNAVQYLVDRWHRDWKAHKGVNNAPTRDAAARMLQAEGYATDPRYAEKLIRIMNQEVKVVRGNPLSVPYFSQRDSEAPGQAERMCFSSSCAMLVAALRPGAITGPNADDQYLATVRRFGDTTDAAAQVRALGTYGIAATFTQQADWDDLERQIDAGVPVPCGFLHRGTSAAPSGGGHWLTVIGHTAPSVIVNDPWGEMDVRGGTYISTNGARLAYSRKNWGPRWLVEGPGSGWAIIAKP
jgi:hypothetical protein